jgi:hypothetical protein
LTGVRKQALVAAAIVLEGSARGVGGAAVGLDDQPPVAPEEVGLGVASAGERDPDVDLRPGEAGTVAEGEEGFLEVVAGDPFADVVVAEDGAQHRRSATAVRARQDGIERGRVEQPPDFGLVARAFQLAAVDDVGEVEQGPGDGGAGDGVVGGDVLRLEPPRPSSGP